MSIVGQAVHDGVGHDLVAEDGESVVKGAVAGQDDGTVRPPECRATEGDRAQVQRG